MHPRAGHLGLHMRLLEPPSATGALLHAFLVLLQLLSLLFRLRSIAMRSRRTPWRLCTSATPRRDGHSIASAILLALSFSPCSRPRILPAV
eukprot:scaffold1440_cov332-Pavlova_lutheri.AAC.37